jgi:hypothetical protein
MGLRMSRSAPRSSEWRAAHSASKDAARPLGPSPADLKARQAAKIRELGDALVASGLLTLDDQAKALGLSRSTAWTILRATHKHSGLSATVVRRMLRQPQLAPVVRARILEYIKEKSAGSYGHNPLQRLRFMARLSRP